MMRKLFVALLVGAVVVALAAPAFAADLKFTGHYRVRGQFDENLRCALDADAPGGGDCSGNLFQTRFKPRFDVETEGGVRGVLNLEIGDVFFGRDGGGHGADGINVETKWAYLDFPIPATPLRLRAGIQPFFLSKALFLDDDGSGLSLYGKVGEINVNAWWMRANKVDGGNGSFLEQLSSNTVDPVTEASLGAAVGGTNVGRNGEFARDLYGLDVSFSPMKDLNLNAYLVYDHDSELSSEFAAALPEASIGFWVGVAGSGKVQNIRWDLDFVYGTKETPHPADTTVKADQKGYLLDGGVGMALPGTPLDLELRGWFASGWDGSLTGDVDAFPVLWAGSGAHNTGAQLWSGAPAIDPNDIADNPQNTWSIGVIARYTVSPTLRLTGNVHYIGTQEEGGDGVGTNPEPSPASDGYLFGVDSVGTDFGVRIDYTIARGLVFTLTASHLLLGDDTATDGTRFDDITKIGAVVNYGF